MEGFLEAEGAMDPLFITSITASELLHGVFRATPERRANREGFVEAVLMETPVLSFDLACARQHAKLWAALASTGQQIGPHDMMIAATCLRFGHRLATLNEREFSRVPNLRLADARRFAA